MHVLGMILFLLTSGCAGIVATPPSLVSSPAPALDLAELESRLRETNSIGVITKLVLWDEASDLLNQFRAHHQNGQSTGVTLLRQPYNMLILKLLVLIQDSDPNLARFLSRSRGAIWRVLADPKTFNALT